MLATALPPSDKRLLSSLPYPLSSIFFLLRSRLSGRRHPSRIKTSTSRPSSPSTTAHSRRNNHGSQLSASEQTTLAKSTVRANCRRKPRGQEIRSRRQGPTAGTDDREGEKNGGKQQPIARKTSTKEGETLVPLAAGIPTSTLLAPKI